MSESKSHITTGEAAEIVQVHESTVKRWCDAGELAFALTAGGHRRIELQSLLRRASDGALDCSLLLFAADAEAVYESVTCIVRERDFDRSVTLARDWLGDGRADVLAAYFCYLCDRSVPCSTIAEHVIQPIMHQIGQAWEDGDLGVGDEHRLSNVMIDALFEFRSGVHESTSKNGRLAVVACLEGNRHDIAANLVRIVLEAAGWTVLYLGADVPLVEVVLQQRKFGASLVCLSTADPQIASDAVRSTRVLARMYEESQPYRLAIGGRPLRELRTEPLTAVPFLEYQMFTSMPGFAKWIDEVASEPVKAPEFPA